MSATPSRIHPRALALVGLTGVLWALFCLVLFRAGHAPSRTLVPLPRAGYYAAQAAFVVPLLLVQWAVCAVLAQRVARAWGGAGGLVALADRLAPALALPLVGVFLVPDIAAYQLAGFGALGKVVRVTAPLTFVLTGWLAARAVRDVHKLTHGRALAAAAVGVLGQALLGGLLLR